MLGLNYDEELLFKIDHYKTNEIIQYNIEKFFAKLYYLFRVILQMTIDKSIKKKKRKFF